MPAPEPSAGAAEFASRKFDFLVVGGGTAGLTLAARLSEDPDISVGVLEAGAAALDDDSINIPGLYGRSLGSKYDWQFETVSQPGLGGRSLPWPRGRVLGGTSAINFMTWNRANRDDYDAWEKLGNAGWGWDELLPFFKKSETLHPPNDESVTQNKLYHDPGASGREGPVQVIYGVDLSPSHRFWHDTLNSLGVETNKAHVAGSNVGVWTNLGAVDPRYMTRSYAATAYYLPSASRPNLVVLTNALVEEVLLSKQGDTWVADGVRFNHGGQQYVAHASHEVIVAAGSVQSPQILELSGIGNSEILSRAGVTVKVDNPNVGENLQEHIMSVVIFEVDASLANPDDLKQDLDRQDLAREEYLKSRSGPLTILPSSVSYIPLSHVIPPAAFDSIVSKVKALSSFPEAEQAILEHRFEQSVKLGQIEYIFDLGNWSASFTPDASDGKKYGTCLVILQYPFSRGSIHIRPVAGDALPSTIQDKPVIDPKYYEGPHGQLDFEVMTHCSRYAEKIAQTPPLSQIIRSRAFPPETTGETDWEDWVVKTTVTDWHPVGTCAMGGHRGIKGGVVDERLRVYGVKGLRVIDASIIPLQISSHTQATVYAIAEKGAQMVLEDLKAT